MQNSSISYEKYVKESFFKKLNDAKKESYLNYIKNLHSSLSDLIIHISKGQDDILNDDDIDDFIFRLMKIKGDVDINEWKYYMMDSILKQENIQYSEVQVTEHINYLFDKHLGN